MNPYTEKDEKRDENMRGQFAEKTCVHCGYICRDEVWGKIVYERPYRCTIDKYSRDCEGRCKRYKKQYPEYYTPTSWQTIKDRILIWSFWIVGIIIIWLIAKQC